MIFGVENPRNTRARHVPMQATLLVYMQVKEAKIAGHFERSLELEGYSLGGGSCYAGKLRK